MNASRDPANGGASVPEDPRIGAHVGPYVLVSLIARGDRSDLFLARNRVTGGDWALKLMELGPEATREIVEQFIREVGVGHRLHHKHIIHCLEAARDERKLYIVMEYFPAAPMARRFRSRPAAPGLVAAIGMQLASAVAYAHSLGVIHRNLSPANALIDGSGMVKILNYGLAKASQDEHFATVTVDVNQIGDLPYQSPELLADPHRVTPKSDLYSIAGMLYFCLTGRAPYEGETVGQVLGQIGKPPMAPAELRPDVPAELDALLLAGLASDPAARPASAAEFGLMLKRIRDSLPAAQRGEDDLRETMDRDEPGEELQPVLRVFDPEQGAFYVRLVQPRYTIGRSKQCSIRLCPATISREHALIGQTKTGWGVECLSNRGGLLLNGQETSRALLQHGDTLQLSACTLQFRMDPMAPERRKRKGFIAQFSELPTSMRVRYRLLTVAPKEVFIPGDTLPVGDGGILVPLWSQHEDRLKSGAECVEIELTWPNGKKGAFLGEILTLDYAEGSQLVMGVKLHQTGERRHNEAVGSSRRSDWFDPPSME